MIMVGEFYFDDGAMSEHLLSKEHKTYVLHHPDDGALCPFRIVGKECKTGRLIYAEAEE